MDTIRQHFNEAKELLEVFQKDENNLQSIKAAGDLLFKCFSDGNKVISCGNGGSMSDAMHFAEELTGRYRDDRRALPALCISDASHISCVGNDYGFESIFSRYIEALGNNGDVLLVLSTSGNSPNILRAVEAAKQKGMKVVALTGKDGGTLGPLADVELRVPHTGYSDRIQEIHIKIIHILILLIERQVIE